MTIKEIKERLSIEKVLEHYNLIPKNNRLNCPWHKDNTPSLQIYPTTNTWTCFSSNCNAGSGDVIDFVMKYEKITKKEAIVKSKELAGYVRQRKERTQFHLISNSITQAYSYFKQATRGRGEYARKYLSKRGLDPLKVDVGYNSAQFHHRENNVYVKAYAEAGLLTPKGNRAGYKVFAKYCIIFPLRNQENYITGLYGRSTLDEDNSKHYYLKNSKGLYPNYPALATTKMIIPESIIDTATLLQLSSIKSNYSLLASYGTNRLSKEHLSAIQQWATNREHLEIIFFFDGDEAGEKGVLKQAEKLKVLLPYVIISKVNTLADEDVNSLFLNYGEDCILSLLEERTILYQPVVNQTPITNKSTDQDLNTPKFDIPQSFDTPDNPIDTSNPEALIFNTEELDITVLGGIKISGLDRMKVTLKIQLKNSHYNPIRQHLDLYHNDQLIRLIRTINEELELPTNTVNSTLQQLIEHLENYRINRIQSIVPKETKITPISHEQRTHAENYLKDPKLMANLIDDLGKTGIVGELYNRTIMYLVFLSRISEEPLHIISFGASGTGKTHLQESIGKLIPKEGKIEVTAFSGNSLYYFQKGEIKNKVILIEDMDGAQDVLYPLRELQSKQKITKRVSLKDTKGNLKAVTISVQGPVCIAGCTTKTKIYEDNANRSILIYIDTSKEQDERIMQYQRDLSAGITKQKEEEQYSQLLLTVQTILRPLKVINPYAPHLKIPSSVFKKRRSNWIYLRFIETITLLHQYQRPLVVKDGVEFIETTTEDIAWANQLLKGVLLRKSDELSQATRHFFERLKAWLKKVRKEQFKTNEVRKELHLTASSLKRYLPELTNCGHLKVVGGSKAKGYLYEVVSYQEYKTLQTNIDSELEQLLQKIKNNKKEVVSSSSIA